MKCNQCDSAYINGVFCHEHGCPNRNKIWDNEEGEWINPKQDEEDEWYDEYEEDYDENQFDQENEC